MSFSLGDFSGKRLSDVATKVKASLAGVTLNSVSDIRSSWHPERAPAAAAQSDKFSHENSFL